MIPIKTHIPPNLSLESRQEQMSRSGNGEFYSGDTGRQVVQLNPDIWDYLDRQELVLLVEILRSDCDRLRRELDDAKGVIR